MNLISNYCGCSITQLSPNFILKLLLKWLKTLSIKVLLELIFNNNTNGLWKSTWIVSYKKHIIGASSTFHFKCFETKKIFSPISLSVTLKAIPNMYIVLNMANLRVTGLVGVNGANGRCQRCKRFFSYENGIN